MSPNHDITDTTRITAAAQSGKLEVDDSCALLASQQHSNMLVGLMLLLPALKLHVLVLAVHPQVPPHTLIKQQTWQAVTRFQSKQTGV